jgi:hypothetical protein
MINLKKKIDLTSFKKFVRENWFILILILVSFFVLFLTNYFSVADDLKTSQQHIYLADSFLHGKTYFINGEAQIGGWVDTALFNNKHYWPQGFLPPFILSPFVLVFGINFQMSYLSFILVLIIFIIVYKLNNLLKIKKNDSLWLAFFLVFSTIFLAQILLVNSYAFNKILVMMFLLLALYEFFSRRRFWLCGLYIALAGLTRGSAYFAILFFILEILFNHNVWRIKLKELFFFLLPVFISVLVMFFYNYIRFGNILESGYNLQILALPFFEKMREIGLFSLKHIPTNIYYFLFKGPEFVAHSQQMMVLSYPYISFNWWGLSIIFTSPLFLYLLFKIKFNDKRIIYSLLTIFTIAACIFSYYGIGFTQFGYAYALDFYPFLYLILVMCLAEDGLTKRLKIIIFLSFLFNVYLMYNSNIFSYIGLY